VNAGAIVTKYTYNDIIGLTWFLVTKTEIFQIDFSQTLATATKPTIGFSVPVDATNLYVDYRLGNKVYVKLLNQYTDINYGSLRIGVFMLTPIMKEQWADCLKTTIKSIECILY
jgi:hypothetical protein